MNESTVDLDKALCELQAYVADFVKKNPRSKANRYFKELETSIDKKKPIGLLREISTKLALNFPTGHEYEVKKLLEKLFDCFQVIKYPTGQVKEGLGEQERTAQRTTGYAFSEFQGEMLALINRYTSIKLLEKYNAFERDYELIQIKPAQEGALDQLRLSAVDLKDHLKDKINVSPGCAAFLQELTYAGTSVFGKDQPRSQDQLPHQEGASKLVGGSKTTIMYSTNPVADHKSQMSVTQNQGSEQRSSSSIFLQSLSQSMRVKDFDAKKMLKELQPAEPLEKELLDSFVVLKEENARLSKNNERTTELEAQLRNTTSSFDAHKNEALERENYMKNQFEEMQRKMMTELENTKSHFRKKLREAKEEADSWKTQLEMTTEDNAKQKQRLSEELHRLHGENRQLKSRSSSSIFLQSLNQSMRVKDFDAKKMLKELQPAEPLEKELLDSFVILKEENARLSKNNERTTDLEAQLRNTMNSFDAHKNETIERENYMQNQFEEMQRKMMTEFENTKSNYGKKLREARDEADQWKTQLEMMAEDNAKQTQRLSVEIHGDRQLKSRMTQRTTDYTFTNFQAEIAAMIKRYCSSILQEKYNAFERDYEGIQIKHVQEGAFNQLRQSVIGLRNFLRDGNYNISEGCIAFLQDMINGVPELVKDHPKSQDQLPHQDGSSNIVGGSKATFMYSTKPEADQKKLDVCYTIPGQ